MNSEVRQAFDCSGEIKVKDKSNLFWELGNIEYFGYLNLIFVRYLRYLSNIFAAKFILQFSLLSAMI